MRLSATEATVERVADALDADGCVVVEQFISDEKVAALKDELEPHRQQTPQGRNDFEGFDTRRIYALFAKVRGFDELATHPLLLGVLDRVLGHYQLSGPVGIDIGPGESRAGPAPRRRRLPAVVAAPAGGAEHDVGARRLHRRTTAPR